MALRTHKIGLNANRPIVLDTGRLLGSLAATVSDPTVIADTGAAWVRVNFVLGPWTHPDDQRRFSGRTWYETYRTIVGGFVDNGLNVYGLVGHEIVNTQPDFFRDSVASTPPQERARAERWLDAYVAAFGRIAALFSDMVGVFESFNEPDDWHGGHRNWIHPSWFAIMLDRIHREVKEHLALDSVKLVSGPLQGLEINDNAAPTQYLRDTYEFGKGQLGWGLPDRPFPFDGVGYHLYVREGFNPNWPEHESAVRQIYSRFVGGMLRVVRAAEGPQSTKRLFISEIGWPSNRDSEEEREFQARNVSLALNLIAADPGVAAGMWFCTEDFDPGQRNYGLYNYRQATPAGRKPSFGAFSDFCSRFGRGVLSGTLTSPSGSPRSGYQIVLRGVSGSVTTTTNGAGHYSFHSLPAGSYRLSVVGTNLIWSVTSDGRTPLSLSLRLPTTSDEGHGVICGTISADSGAPQPGLLVLVEGTSSERRATTDDSGGFRCENLANGIYVLRVVGADVTRPVWCDGKSVVTVAIALPAHTADGARISGALCDAEGKPRPGRQVSLTGPGFSATATTGPRGEYSFEGLAKAVYTIQPVGSQLRQAVWLDGETHVVWPLALPGASSTPNQGCMRGTLRDHDGVPQGGYQVRLSMLNSGLTCALTTAQDGTYAFDQLPAGTYAVDVVGSGVTHSLWLDGCSTVTHDLVLAENAVGVSRMGIIRGNLRDSQGQPIRNRGISVTGTDCSNTTRTDELGAFCFDGLAEGVFTLRVGSDGPVRHLWSDGFTPVDVGLVI